MKRFITKGAFTLAEVLVTLGIIGIVAAMTMPTLMGHYQKQSYTTQLHKVYTELAQATLNCIRESNAVSLRESKFQRNGADWFLENYFKTVQTCTNTNRTNCLAPSYRNITGQPFNPNFNASTRCGILASGAAICLTGTDVVVDVNSKNGPNVYGRDLFVFSLTGDGSIYASDNNDTLNCSDIESDTYGACLSKILDAGWKMDY